MNQIEYNCTQQRWQIGEVVNTFSLKGSVVSNNNHLNLLEGSMAQSKEDKRIEANLRNHDYNILTLDQKIEKAISNGHENSKQVKKLMALKKKEVK